MAQNEVFDVAILGSGPGGYVAAIRAGQLGLKTAIIEKDPQFGGTCLLRGCIPTKALLHTADLLDEIRHSKTHGITVKDVALDMAVVQARKDKVVNQLATGVKSLLRKNKVTPFTAFGVLSSANKIALKDPAGKVTGEVQAKNIVLATGSDCRDIPSLPADHKVVLNSDDILKLPEVPKSLLVIGAGAVGVEFASIYKRYGSEVTLVEMLPTLVPVEDEEIGKALAEAFIKQGMKVHTESTVTSLKVTGDQAEAVIKGKDGKEQKGVYHRVLVAIGRKPMTEGIGLETVGVKSEKGYVLHDPQSFQTNVPGIYAIGDIIKAPWLAHAASHEGIHVVTHLAGKETEPMNMDKVPNGTYCFPEVASVGLTEKKAKERGYDVRVGKFPFVGIGKALILDQTQGYFVKIVADKKYDEVLGVHIIGPKATELLAAATVMLSHEATVQSVENTVIAHPTLSEALGEAAHAVYGMAIHF
ncbi:MAG: dihydrolipoyl dehydrogenase [Candidatus Eiseniibacteriota bacterium]